MYVIFLRKEGLIWLENNIVTFFNYSRHSHDPVTQFQVQNSCLLWYLDYKNGLWSSRMPSHILFNKAGQEHPEQLSHINITQGVHRSFVYNVGWLNNGECYPSKEQYYYSRIFSCVKWGSCVSILHLAALVGEHLPALIFFHTHLTFWTIRKWKPLSYCLASS